MQLNIIQSAAFDAPLNYQPAKVKHAAIVANECMFYSECPTSAEHAARINAAMRELISPIYASNNTETTKRIEIGERIRGSEIIRD